MPRRRPSSTRSFPGGLTLEAWLTRPLLERLHLIYRAQCELLGSFRFCADKRCRRHRTCCGDDPEACRQRLWSRKTVRPKTPWPKTFWPKTLRHEWARLDRLKSL